MKQEMLAFQDSMHSFDGKVNPFRISKILLFFSVKSDKHWKCMDGRIIFGQWMKNLEIKICFTFGKFFKRKSWRRMILFNLGRFRVKSNEKSLKWDNWELIEIKKGLACWMDDICIWIGANEKRTFMKILRTCQL